MIYQFEYKSESYNEWEKKQLALCEKITEKWSDGERTARRLNNALNLSYFAYGFVIARTLLGLPLVTVVGTRLDTITTDRNGPYQPEPTVSAYSYVILPDGGGNGFHMFTFYQPKLKGEGLEQQYEMACARVRMLVDKEDE